MSMQLFFDCFNFHIFLKCLSVMWRMTRATLYILPCFLGKLFHREKTTLMTTLLILAVFIGTVSAW